MITNHTTVAILRRGWPQHDLFIFDNAVTVLDSATCHSDVYRGLTNPPYNLANPGRTGERHISVRRVLMLKYTLTEDVAAGTADVDIIP